MAGVIAKPRRIGLARALSKLGIASRSEAAAWIGAGRVRVDGRVVTDPEFPTVEGVHRVQVDGQPLEAIESPRRYIVMNKPRGLVTTTRDEHDRATVYHCFDGADLGWIAPVGRLDKASEGLLLFTNDSQWAARITEPARGPDKTYHVQVDCIPDEAALAAMRAGVACDGMLLAAKSASLLRMGHTHAWLEIVLDEGRNRQIRRLLAALDIGVLRLVRVAIGTLQLGELPKAQWRELTEAEVAALAGD